MCCTLGPAQLSKTILYAGESSREGRTIHVLGYQNRAENRSPGPNAMILPFPAAASMGRDNVLDLRSAPTVLEEYARAVAAEPATKSGRLEDIRRRHDRDLGRVSAARDPRLSATLSAVPRGLSVATASHRGRDRTHAGRRGRCGQVSAHFVATDHVVASQCDARPRTQARGRGGTYHYFAALNVPAIAVLQWLSASAGVVAPAPVV